jgi:putative phosphoribosyl transferase
VRWRLERWRSRGCLARPKRRALSSSSHMGRSGRLSPRNSYVAEALHRSGLATLLLDLLTPAEETRRSNVFDISLLAKRLLLATAWAREQAETAQLPIDYFGASTGAGAALAAAADDRRIFAVVSRSGRPDLAGEALERVRTPTLLIVGGRDHTVVALNREAQRRLLKTESELVIVPVATHLFEEPAALDDVVAHASRWFLTHLPQLQRQSA